MLINLSKFVDSSQSVLKFSNEIDRIDNPVLDDYELILPIKVSGEIYKVDGELQLYINGDFTYVSQCDRCLIETKKDMSFKSTAKLIKDSGNANDSEESDEVIYYNDDELDLKEYIWNQIVSSLPMKNLCSENCKGLCPRCGADLNKEKCQCDTSNVDLRFEKLRELSLND